MTQPSGESVPIFRCTGCGGVFEHDDLEQVQPDGHDACPLCEDDPPLTVTVYTSVSREFVGIDQWRSTTYDGPDGHQVNVAIPRRTWVDVNGDPANGDYDEDAETSMLRSLVAAHIGGEASSRPGGISGG